MQTIKINYQKISAKEIGFIAGFLQTGKTIVYPTDTIYGLGCSALKEKAIAKIYRIKNRDKKKPLLVLISDFKMLAKYFQVDKKQRVFLHKIWPGKVSVILNKKSALSGNISGGLSSAAVRLPKSGFLTKMIKELGAPVVSTSLNISGKKHLEKADKIDGYFGKIKPDLIIDAGIKKGKPSRLIDLRDMKNIKVLRS